MATGIPEYKLVLTISLQLRDELEARGYRVIMIRETNDVDLSNRERAEIANASGRGSLFADSRQWLGGFLRSRGHDPVSHA